MCIAVYEVYLSSHAPSPDLHDGGFGARCEACPAASRWRWHHLHPPAVAWVLEGPDRRTPHSAGDEVKAGRDEAKVGKASKKIIRDGGT